MATIERKIMCGICYTPFVQISETEWMGVCEHRAGVVAHVGDPEKITKKKRITKKKNETN